MNSSYGNLILPTLRQKRVISGVESIFNRHLCVVFVISVLTHACLNVFLLSFIFAGTATGATGLWVLQRDLKQWVYIFVLEILDIVSKSFVFCWISNFHWTEGFVESLKLYHCIELLVVLTTEWLSWLQSSWGDSGYEKLILVATRGLL